MVTRIERSAHPMLSSPNRFKLAVFGVNVSGGCSMTTNEAALTVDWAESVRIAQAAERAGIEAMVPVARWRGFGGATNFNHRNFETFTWAAGLAAVTSKIGIFATFHLPTAHPVRAAKEVATVDHISGGRFGLNIVAGWNEEEIAMFGAPQREHDERYAVADEWTRLVKRLWTEPEFDHAGTYFTVPKAYSEPKPVQTPYPPIMSAGNSPAGQRFAAEHADFNFIVAPDLATAAELCAGIKKRARDEFGRDIKVFGQGYIVCRDTEEEAIAFREKYVTEQGDWQGVRNLLDTLIPNSQSALGEQWESMAANLIAGYGALPLVGTPDQVVAGMGAMADAGLDGITISWVDYEAGLAQFQDVLLPRLVDAGLRSG